ncbi:TPA: hypothetical protein ACPOH1_001212 [Haemophilus influenzae]
MSNFFNSLFSDKGEIKGIDNQYSVSEIVDILKEEGYSINVMQDNFLVFRLQGTNVVVIPMMEVIFNFVSCMTMMRTDFH